MWYIYIYIHPVEYHSAIKQKAILTHATTWMDLEGIMLSEISQTKQRKYHVISLTYGYKLEKQKTN